MSACTLRRTGWALLLFVGALTLIAQSSAASHDPATLPRLRGDAVVDAALANLAMEREDQGCSFRPTDTKCNMNTANWAMFGVAAAGVDPDTWPDPQHSLLDWILAHPEQYGTSSGAGAATSYAFSILTVRAAGINPREVPQPDGSNVDLVRKLLDQYRPPSFGLPRDNIYAIWALQVADYAGPERDTSVATLEASQRPDGGLSWNAVEESEVDITAWAVMALATEGRQGFTDRAVEYLRAQQVIAGDMQGCWFQGRGTNANAESTVAAVQALIALHVDPWSWSPGGRSPYDCLLGLRRDDGGFASRPQNLKSTASTEQVLAGLAWTPWASMRQPTQTEDRFVDASFNSSLDLAIPEGFLRDHNATRASWPVRADVRGNQTYHGFAWSPRPHPVDIVLQVPHLPRAPTLQEAFSVRHGAEFDVRVDATDSWTERIRLQLPSGPAVEEPVAQGGAAFRLRFDEPGNMTVTVTALNRHGEPGPSAHSVVVVVNDGPTVAVTVPDRARRDAPIRPLLAVSDPENDSVTVSWSMNGTVFATERSPVLTPRAPGPTEYDLVATDSWGAHTRHRVSIDWIDSPARIDHVEPVSAQPGTVEVFAAVSDPDGDAVSVHWFHGSSPLASGARARIPLESGQHVLRVVASTPYGQVEVSHALRVAPGSLAVRLSWEPEALRVDAMASFLRIGSLEGPPPLRIPPPPPGQRLVVEAIEDDRVVRLAEVTVPTRPPPLQENRPPEIVLQEPRPGDNLAFPLVFVGSAADPEGHLLNLAAQIGSATWDIPLESDGTWRWVLPAEIAQGAPLEISFTLRDGLGGSTGLTWKSGAPSEAGEDDAGPKALSGADHRKVPGPTLPVLALVVAALPAHRSARPRS